MYCNFGVSDYYSFQDKTIYWNFAPKHIDSTHMTSFLHLELQLLTNKEQLTNFFEDQDNVFKPMMYFNQYQICLFRHQFSGLVS